MKRLFTLLGLVLGLGMGVQGYGQGYQPAELLRGHNPGLLNQERDRVNNGTPQPDWTIVLPFGTSTAWSAVQQLPFAFDFFGQPVTAFKVTHNGVLTFSTAATGVPGTAPTALPTAGLPDQSVGIWAGGVQAGRVASKTFGTAPHRQLWVTFGTIWDIVLEETSNAVYLVNKGTLGIGAPVWSLGLQRTATQGVQVAGSPAVPSLSPEPSSYDPIDNYYYAFWPTPRPVADGALVAHTLLPVADSRYPLRLGGTLRNLGSQALAGYEVGYRINNEPPVRATLTPATAVASGDTLSWRHPVAWQPPARGSYRVKLWVRPATGAAPDNYPLNDTLQATVLMADSTMRRTVVLESFGSSTCPPCGPGNTNVRNVNQALRGRFVEAHYQQNYPSPGDPYNTLEATDRKDRYGYSGGIPFTVIDGVRAMPSLDYRRSHFEEASRIPARVRIMATYQVSGTTVRATAQVRALDPLPASADYELVLAITERETRNNYRFNERVFYHVFRKFMPSYPLRLPALASGQTATFTQTYTFPANNTIEHFDSLQVVAMVQHRTNEDILQATYATLTTTTATQPASAGPAFALLPNPSASGHTELRLTLPRAETPRVEVLDVLGRSVAQPAPVALGAGPAVLPLDLRGLAPGLYLVRLSTAAGMRVERLQVQ